MASEIKFLFLECMLLFYNMLDANGLGKFVWHLVKIYVYPIKTAMSAQDLTKY